MNKKYTLNKKKLQNLYANNVNEFIDLREIKWYCTYTLTYSAVSKRGKMSEDINMALFIFLLPFICLLFIFINLCNIIFKCDIQFGLFNRNVRTDHIDEKEFNFLKDIL